MWRGEVPADQAEWMYWPRWALRWLPEESPELHPRQHSLIKCQGHQVDHVSKTFSWGRKFSRETSWRDGNLGHILEGRQDLPTGSRFVDWVDSLHDIRALGSALSSMGWGDPDLCALRGWLESWRKLESSLFSHMKINPQMLCRAGVVLGQRPECFREAGQGRTWGYGFSLSNLHCGVTGMWRREATPSWLSGAWALALTHIRGNYTIRRVTANAVLPWLMLQACGAFCTLALLLLRRCGTQTWNVIFEKSCLLSLPVMSFFCKVGT